jgi:CHAT domain-containing protein/tetratricopeptide (TPR) repeat protein
MTGMVLRGFRENTASLDGHDLIAYLVTQNPRQAIEILEPSAEQKHDAAVWNDLAAAYIARAQQADSPALLADAVAAADAALDIDKNYPEALFNRAVALERLGLRDAAREAWKTYLRVALNDGWSREAKEHLATLSIPLANFDESLAHDSELIANGDTTAAARLMRMFPDQSRAYVEETALTAWATRVQKDPGTASRYLTVARAIGNELATRGDTLVRDQVAAIDRLHGEELPAFASAQASLGEGRQLVKETRPTPALPLLQDAAERFTALHAPMAMYARLQTAVALHYDNRIDEGRRVLEQLLPEIPQGDQTLRAEALWQLALSAGAESQWGIAIRALDESIAIFESVGENRNAAIVRSILSETYTLIGDSAKAWTLKIAPLRELGRTTSVRTQVATSAISVDAASHQRWRVALSFLNVEVEMAAQLANPDAHAEALLRRAIAHHSLGQHVDAVHDLAEADGVIAAMKDPALQRRWRADRLAVSAVIAATPREAIAALTTAIDFHQVKGRRMHLPTFYLRRGRALREVGDEVRAQRDFQAGIAELEGSRKSLPDVATRLGIFDASEDLFAEAIKGALGRGDTAGAFAYAEEARARALLDAMGRHAAPSSPPGSIALVEYVDLSSRLLIFVVDHNGTHVAEGGTTPDRIAAQVASFRKAAGDGQLGRADLLSHSLYCSTIGPIAAWLPEQTKIVFVPSRSLLSLPFAALRNEKGSYLIEDHAVVMAPSAAVFMRAASSTTSAAAPENALLVAAPDVAGLERLEGAIGEVRAIARLYPHPTSLIGDHATPSAFLHDAGNADVIQVSSHGDAADSGSRSTALILSGRTGELTPKQVETLRLTHTSVVILAACDTARGETRWTEGSLSMARAFLAAGVPSVVATLWRIPDSGAASFFPLIHRYLSAGAAPADAVRSAQIDSIHRSKVPLSTWASVQVIGR